MPAPEGTPEEIYHLMLQCWQYQPENRPHFDRINTTMESLVKSLRYTYYYLLFIIILYYTRLTLLNCVKVVYCFSCVRLITKIKI